MPLLLERVLSLFFLPLGIAILGALAALTALALRRRTLGAWLLGLALAWLWIWSTPFVAYSIAALLETPHPPQRIEELPAAEAIVLLGGGVKPISGGMLYPDMNGSADRIWHAARLYKAGKAPLIIISDGNVWGGKKNGRRERQSPAAATRILLNEFGIPDDSIVEEAKSRTTWQNARLTSEVAAGLEISKVLLVTSHWHMERALATFENTGLEVVPVPCDHSRWGNEPRPTIFWALPNASALSNSSLSFREFLGYLAYRLRGFI